MKRRSQLELAKAEYLQILKMIDGFDSRSVAGKSWSITLGAASMAASFASQDEEILLVGTLGALLFWIMDGYWRTVHNAYYGRLEELEVFFRDVEQPFTSMQIGSSWYASFHARTGERTGRTMVRPHVAFPHAVILVVTILLFLAELSGLINV